ncbi:MAG: hypothetical protein DRQ55_08685 [Planctomycetota bacterium]|nr:MAG: hypothetical protein DRQ55_08685 [Planctomycetota bacterium]
MDDAQRQLLQALTDGTLEPARQAEADALLASDAEAARFVAEHRALWAALGDAFGDTGVRPEARFRSAVREAHQSQTPRRVIPLRRLTAAAAVLLAALALHFSGREEGALSAEDHQVVRYLHVLRSFDVLQQQAAALDLRYDVEVLHAFEGELEGEG